MIKNTWEVLLDWFNDRCERNKLIRGFNESARNAYISGITPTLLKAKVSKGEKSYRHQYSDWFYTGFRIQVFAGRKLSKKEIITIANVVLNSELLVRRMVVLGWDTLEVHGDEDSFGGRWQLKDYLQISSYYE